MASHPAASQMHNDEDGHEDRSCDHEAFDPTRRSLLRATGNGVVLLFGRFGGLSWFSHCRNSSIDSGEFYKTVCILSDGMYTGRQVVYSLGAEALECDS